MNYGLTDQAIRKLVCSFKDKINNHRHSVADVEGLSDVIGGNGLTASWDSNGNVVVIGYTISSSHDDNGNVTLF